MIKMTKVFKIKLAIYIVLILIAVPIILDVDKHLFVKLIFIGAVCFYTKFIENDFIRTKYLNSSLSEIDKFTGDQFEEFLKWHFRKLGYEAEQTKHSYDKGADLVMYKGGKKIVVQAKRYSGSVGTTAVQEILGAKSYYHADECYVVSNSQKFTKAAIDYAKQTNVILWGRNEIKKNFSLKEVEEYLKPVEKPTLTKDEKPQVKKEVTKEPPICDKCGKPMKLRNGKYGQFYGCTGYPNCKNTKKLN